MGISVLVIDREHTFADALALRLEAEQELEVIAAVRMSAPASCLTAGHQAAVVLLDADLPGQGANRLCEDLSGREAAPRVIMLSCTAEPDRIVAALRAGAAAWVRKDESLQYLLQAIHGVARGETWLPRAQTGLVLGLLMFEQERQAAADQLLASLTQREREVLTWLADGAGRLEVAQRLHVSPHTVRAHLQHLMAKLGVHSTVEAVALTRSRLGQDPARRQRLGQKDGSGDRCHEPAGCGEPCHRAAQQQGEGE
jgi:DNA-binding NarL/FixJ family response regulator